MDRESFERSSAKIEHDPSIKRYTEFHQRELKQNKKNVFRIFGFICSSISLILVIFITRYILTDNSEDSIILKLLGKSPKPYMLKTVYAVFLIFFVITLNSTLYFLLMLIRMLFMKTSPEKLFIPNVLGKFSARFALILAFNIGAIYSEAVLKKLFKKLVSGSTSDLDDIVSIFKFAVKPTKDTDSDINIIAKIIEILIKGSLIFLLRDIIIYTLNFNVHYQYYSKRIEKNTEKISILRSMNDIINAGYTGDIDVISTRLIQVLTMGRPVPNDGSSPLVTASDLQKFFGEATALKIFEYCNREGEIGEEEIRGFYVSTLVEQAAIVKSIEQHNSTVENFRSILNIVVFAVMCYSFAELIPGNKDSPFKSSTFFMGLIFTTNYTFSDSIKVFTSNICFAFLIRPYEVGDIIYFSDCLYKVKEINLMSTVLFDGCKYVIVPNQKISGDAIKNLRINRVFDVEYRCLFPLDSFETQSKALIDRVNEYIKKRSSEFHKNPFYKGTPITINGMVESTLVVKFNCDVADIEILNERRLKFFNVLVRLLKQQ